MRRMLAGLAGIVPLVFVMAGTAYAAEPVAYADVTAARGEKVAGQYIVTLKPGTSLKDVTSATSVTPLFTYRSAMHGFAAKLSRGQLQSLRHNRNVKAIEQDQIARASTTQYNPPWGLDRIGEHYLPMDAKYSYTYTGYKIRTYIIDTGIQASHAQFGGRALAVYDSVGDGQNGVDCMGHGSHVAGTIAGTNFGLAKGAKIFGVRVLDCNGSGSTESVVAGIEWVTANAKKPAVANMSLGGGADAALDAALKASIDKGITYAVAAGNDSADACGGSPAKEPAAITVGATDDKDAKANFSNWGKCVDLFAPGVDVESVGITSPDSTAKMSGTSMATPHVAGGIALYLSANPEAKPADVATALIGASTPDKVGDPGTGSPNKLLFVGKVDPAQP